MLELKNVCAGYDGVEVLHDISCTFPLGSCWCVLGANGCGKTTLLRAMAGLIPHRGQVLLEGREISGLKRRELAGRIAVFSQINTVYFPYTVYDTVMLGRYQHMRGALFGGPSPEDRAMVERCLEFTGLSNLRRRGLDAAIVRCVVDCVGGQIPVIAGGGSNSTETSLMKSRTFRDCGVDGLLLITPYYNKANQKGMYRHFATVAEQVKLPILLYNVPSRTGCSLSLDCIEALSKIDNIKGIKEASGNISFAAKVGKLLNDDFCMMSGNDDMIVPILSLGGSGVVSVWANLCPREVHDLCQAWFDGDVNRAREMQIKYLDLINALFIEVNPIPIKEAMNLRGMGVGGYRLPLCEMDEGNRVKLIQAMKVLD